MQKKYTVILSETLTNTTLNNIENKINRYEDHLEERYDERDYIRRIDVSNLNVTSVRKSKELKNPKFANSVIVIFVNETESDW